MPPLLRALANRLAREQLKRSVELSVADSAKVNYLGMRSRPPSRITIGEGTIFEGRITAERLDASVSVGQHSFVGGSWLICASKIDIGNDVLISWGCTIVDHNSHSVQWNERRSDVREWYDGKKDWSHVRIAPIQICDRAWIGFNSIILAGVTIGEGAVVACGSIVTRDVAPNTLVAGSPARPIRSIDNDI